MKKALLVIMAAGILPAQTPVDPPSEFAVMTYSNVKPESNEEWYVPRRCSPMPSRRAGCRGGA